MESKVAHHNNDGHAESMQAEREASGEYASNDGHAMCLRGCIEAVGLKTSLQRLRSPVSPTCACEKPQMAHSKRGLLHERRSPEMETCRSDFYPLRTFACLSP
eukprot:6214495-Pleurochrysis_carterae.AAC.1